MNFYNLFAQKTLKASSKPTPSDSMLLEKYSTLASGYSRSGDLDKMRIQLQRGLDLAEKVKNERSRGIFLSKIAAYHKIKYQTDSGLIYANKAVLILQREKEWKWLSETMYMKCMFYLDKNDQVSTIKELISLVNFNEKYNQHGFTGASYNLLAHTFRRLNDTLNEKKYILKHLEFAEKQNSDYQRLYAFEMYGSFLVRQKKFRAANMYFSKSHLLAKHQKDDGMNAEILLSMGSNLISLKQYQKSFEALRSAEKIALKHIHLPGWNANLSTNYAHVSSLFLAMGKPGIALDYARRSFALVEKEPMRYDYLLHALKNQVTAQKALGRFQEALQSYEKLQEITQNIDINKDKEIAKDIEAKYQLEKSEKEKKLSDQNLQIKELELQNEQNQGKILSILLSILTLSMTAGVWFYRKIQLYNLQLNKKKQQLEELNETKDKLFGIIGHDLRASAVNLNSTLTLLEQNYLTQPQLTVHTAALRKKVNAHQTILNNLLYWALSQRQVLWANPHLVSLQTNIEETLDSLHGLVKEKSLYIEWSAILADFIYVDENHLQIILYNIIHNAIKFSPFDGVIQIRIIPVSDKTVLHITNQGEAFDWHDTAKTPTLKNSHRGTSGEKGTGLGLLVCAELMKLNQATIRAFSAGETTTLELSFSMI